MTSFLELAKERYSVRSYLPTPVEQEKIDKILEAARCAPTACNYQPQKIFVLTSAEARRKLAAVTPCTFNAPLIFVVCCLPERAARGKVRPGFDFGDTDAAIVCTHMMLEARDLGLGSCWVGWFNENEVRDALGLGSDVRVCDLLPVGYPAPDAAPSPLHTKSRPDAETVKYL